ncbi:hypothetical protein H4R34_001629 [Dimargaris verticillata]|uniref:Kinase-like domain-containing protein n=1 Tax=Dimargaris verticillata TaxID=2761393 RepID=A0A9W8BAE3_9FUNG|nr:hypothetical protein H4R34_001629 [Dimargaris verticillata]
MNHSVFHFDEDLNSNGDHLTKPSSPTAPGLFTVEHGVPLVTKLAVNSSASSDTAVENLGNALESVHLATSVAEDVNQAQKQACLQALVDKSAAPATKVGLDDFLVLRLIGRGAYGKVFLVQHKASGQYFAMKTVHKGRLAQCERDMAFTKAERTILEDVKHPFIVQLFYAFQTETKLYLILEYVSGGELFHHMNTERLFTERVARFFVAELVLALEHLHALGIIYRDLKPENCLIDRDGHTVLTDFGLSKLGLPRDGKTSTFCGTIEYMAPEVLDEEPYDQSVDWWSLGILLYDMLTGSPPFKGKNRKAVMDAIRRSPVRYPNYLSPEAKDLISSLLQRDPNQRLGTFTCPDPANVYSSSMSSGTGCHKKKKKKNNKSGPARHPKPLLPGQSRIRAHRFFRDICWDSLIDRTIAPPIIPSLCGDDDTSYFDDEFTQYPIAESPTGDGLPVSASIDYLFQGFSYVAPYPLG